VQRDQFTAGAGSDLLFVSHIDLKAGWQLRNIDLALVRRLCHTIGEAFELAVMPCESIGNLFHGESGRCETKACRLVTTEPTAHAPADKS